MVLNQIIIESFIYLSTETSKRPKQNIYVVPVTLQKILGLVGRENILFY